MKYYIKIRTFSSGKDFTFTTTVDAKNDAQAIQNACEELSKTNPEMLRLTCEFTIKCLG